MQKKNKQNSKRPETEGTSHQEAQTNSNGTEKTQQERRGQQEALTRRKD
jgi:hypothetical protein